MYRSALLAPTAVCVAFATQAAGPANPDQQTQLDKVVVTGSYLLEEETDMATGLGLSPQDTPQSVSVITAQQLRDRDFDTINEVVRYAPGVSTSEIDDVRNTFFARGFEIRNYQIDGVPLAWSLAGDSGETIADTAIYERIELVRGATGLMTGAGDPSASINLVRKRADFTDLQGHLNASYGRWNNRQLTADVGTALNASGSIRGRVIARMERGDAEMDLYEDDKSVFYGVLEADMGRDTLLRVGASRQDSDPYAASWGALPNWFSDGSRTNWPRSTTTAAHWTRWHTTNTNYFASVVHALTDAWQLNANYNYIDNAAKVRLLYLNGTVNQQTGEIENSPYGLPAYPYRSQGAHEQHSFDLQLKGEFAWLGRVHQLVLGALHSEQDSSDNTFAPDYAQLDSVGNFFEWDGSFAEPIWSDTTDVAVDLTTKQTGFYAASRFSLSDRLNVIGGFRLASWEQRGTQYGAVLDYGDDDVLIPYAGVLYDLTPRHRLYASYTEIFQPQNERDINAANLDPLVGRSHEVGLKSRFLDQALETTLSLFLIEQDNLAQAVPGETVPGNDLEQAYREVDGTRSRGVEFEAIGALTADWNISFSVTSFRAEDADDNKVNTDQPRNLVKLFTTWRALPKLTLGGGVNWQDDVYSDVLANPITGEDERLQQDAYALVSLMARYDINAQLSVQLNADNVTDETYYSQVAFFEQYRYGKPANYSLGLTYQF